MTIFLWESYLLISSQVLTKELTMVAWCSHLHLLREVESTFLNILGRKEQGKGLSHDGDDELLVL